MKWTLHVSIFYGKLSLHKKTRAMNLSRLLLLPILASLQQLITTLDAATTDTGCPPATCGNLTVAYPFWLGRRDASSCGPPAFQLTCNSSASGAFLSSSYIKVLGIDYGSRSLVAVHALLAADAACSILFNVSSAFAITDRFRISPSNRELYVLSKCNDGTLPPPGAVPVTNCSGNSTRNFAYLGGSYGTGRPPANDGRCQLSVLLVLGSEAGGATAASYRRLIRGGFRLDWEPVGDCNTCIASGGRCRYGNNTAAFACLCSDGSLRASSCDGKHKSKLILIVSLSAVAGFAFICLSWLIYRYKQTVRSVVCLLLYSTDRSKRSKEEEVLRKCGSLAPKRFKYSELKKITKSFKEELGQGGCGVVFRGSLQDGRTVAVKLLKGSSGNGEDFLNEVVSISQTSHVNIVSLLGFCLEGSNKRALVYEYMPNGSLQNHIYSELAVVVAWETLLKIAVGVARGLEYLHQGCNTRIIHFDIKPHNILLDEEFSPKISDFGLAKLCHLNDSILSTAEARGTVGFIAPEVFSRGFGVVSTKSDVYSYGMVLLEMVRGRNGGIKEFPENSSETFFPHWAYDHLVRVTHNCQVAHGAEEIARKLTLVGLWCVQMTPDNRPSMSRVVEMLDRRIDELEMPPKPFLCSPSQSSNVSSYNSVVVMMQSP